MTPKPKRGRPADPNTVPSVVVRVSEPDYEWLMGDGSQKFSERFSLFRKIFEDTLRESEES